jgi:hypothetical protein
VLENTVFQAERAWPLAGRLVWPGPSAPCQVRPEVCLWGAMVHIRRCGPIPFLPPGPRMWPDGVLRPLEIAFRTPI